MERTRYGLRVTIPVPYAAALEQTAQALKAEGFGVLTSIDVKDTLQRKLAKDFRPYVILGACNPALAARALDAELEVGLLLPCNVIVYEQEPGRTIVAAMAPAAAMSVVGENTTLAQVASDAEQKLERALSALELATSAE